MSQGRQAGGDVDQLRRYNRDLAACLALHALWGGAEPVRITGTLLDVLISMLHLDVAYVWLPDPDNGPPIEAVRPDGLGDLTALAPLLRCAPGVSVDGGPPGEVVLPGGSRVKALSVALRPGRDGHIVAGSRRPDFPSERHRFLLTAAARQAGIALRSAFLVRREQSALAHERAARADAEAANLAKDEFLAMLAHELRNPLAPIRYSVEIIRRAAGGIEAAAHAAAVVERQVSHLGRLLDDLLDVSRVTRGLIELNATIVDLRDVATEALDANRTLMETHGHRLHVVLADQPLWVSADRTRLVQVVDNLLVNASRYTPFGGDVFVSATAEHGQVVLRVRDTGIGIGPDLLPRIFDLFVQGELADRGARGGLGIGLTLVQRLVALHGGSVVADSEGPGRGSEFVVTLPAATRAAEAPAARRPARDGAPMRILVVEDNDDSREMLTVMMQMKGHTVRPAATAAEALRLCAEDAVDVALVDIDLPDADGYSVAASLRASCPGLRLIAVTGFGQPADRARAFVAGFDAHLVKPVSLEDLDVAIGAMPADPPSPSAPPEALRAPSAR